MMIRSKILALAVSTFAIGGLATAQTITVEANKSSALKISGAAKSVVIGNPGVADVAVHDEGLVFITGRTFGTTNLLVFNEAGDQLYSGDVVVTTNTSNLVTVNRAGANFTYDCAESCRSVLAIGDEAGYFEDISTQNEDLVGLAAAN